MLNTEVLQKTPKPQQPKELCPAEGEAAKAKGLCCLGKNDQYANHQLEAASMGKQMPLLPAIKPR